MDTSLRLRNSRHLVRFTGEFRPRTFHDITSKLFTHKMALLRCKACKSEKNIYNGLYINGKALATNTEQLQQNIPSARDDKWSLMMEKKKVMIIITKGAFFLNVCGFSSDAPLLSESVWVSETLTQ